jgi:hypothetical protein
MTLLEKAYRFLEGEPFEEGSAARPGQTGFRQIPASCPLEFRQHIIERRASMAGIDLKKLAEQDIEQDSERSKFEILKAISAS